MKELELKKLRDSNILVQPRYDEYSFSRLPIALSGLLMPEKARPALPRPLEQHLRPNYQKVIVILIDGFGWRFVEEYKGYLPRLREICENSCVLPLSSQFPSTTACHITTLHSGLPVGSTGIFEWFMYEPLVGEIICPLRCEALIRTEQNDQRKSISFDPTEVFPFHSLYASLKNEGIESYVCSYKDYAHSPYSQRLTRGATTMPFSSIRSGAQSLCSLVTTQQNKLYAVLYIDLFDSLAHQCGPSSKRLRHELSTILEILWKELLLPLRKRSDTICFITADHGHTEMKPERTFYLDREIPELGQMLAKTASGSIRSPVGSPRDLFLHFLDSCKEEGELILKRKLSGLAEVFSTEYAIEQGLFGDPVTQRLRERLGTTLVLPTTPASIFWSESGRFVQTFRGHHGGLTRDEVVIPLIACGG